MRKFYVSLLSLFLTLGVLVGCGQTEQQPTETNEKEQTATEEQQELVLVSITKDGQEVVSEKEIQIEEGDKLLDVMKENFEIEENDGFITSIEGISQDVDQQKYWMYEVNGEMASVGAAELELNPDDHVTFDLSPME